VRRRQLSSQPVNLHALVLEFGLRHFQLLPQVCNFRPFSGIPAIP
jgi:hypothetical protein